MGRSQCKKVRDRDHMDGLVLFFLSEKIDGFVKSMHFLAYAGN
jgi:hypothetical protein